MSTLKSTSSDRESATAVEGDPGVPQEHLKKDVQQRPHSLVREVASHLVPDRYLLVVLAIYCALLLPMVPRWTANAALLAAFSNDEPFITQQLDGMTFAPYGNPSNFMEVRNEKRIPAYWLQYRYFNLPYYGGTYLDLGFVILMPAKAAGVPTFPLAPIILRLISFLAGLASLALLYNFARRSVGRFAALFAATALFFGHDFVYMATLIHPDMLQLALSFVALIIAARHARLGDWRGALALGAVLGLIQGTKLGVPYLLPMTGLALFFGAWARSGRQGAAGFARRLLGLAGRSAALTGSAVLAFVASTPYVLFDPFYIRTWLTGLALLKGTSPLIPISFSTWYEVILRDLGWAFVSVILAGLAWAAIRPWLRSPSGPAVVLAVALGTGDLLWFTALGRFWVVLYYLLAALGIAAMLAGGLLADIAGALGRFRLAGVWTGRALLVFAMVLLVSSAGRPAAMANSIAIGLNSDRTPQLRLASWAQGAVPADSNVLFDDEAYFDPARFPLQATNANLIRYVDLFSKQPDYFVLTDYPAGVNWISAKRATQHLDRTDADPYSVRLYQDLIDNNPTPYTPGRTPVAGIELVAAVGLPQVDRVGQPAWFTLFDAGYHVIAPLDRGVQATLSAGHRLLMYRIEPPFYNQPGFESFGFKPISSAPAPGYPAANAFDNTGYVWLAAGTGPSVDGAYIGADYGSSRTAAIRTVRIRWVAEHWLPHRIRIDSSDDGTKWTPVLAKDEVAPADQHGSPGLKRWWETVPLPAGGAHRFWRLVAVDVPPNDYFGVDEVVLTA